MDATILNILDDGNEKKTIIETGFFNGCLYAVSDWINEFPESQFTAVSLDSIKLNESHQFLTKCGLAQNCTLRLQDPVKYLQSQSWIDVAFLNSRNGLLYAVEEFRASASAGAKTIVMTDYQTSASFAIQEALKLGWTFVAHEPYWILRRP